MRNEIFRIIENRASCRNFLDKEIPAEVMNQLLDAAITAPSGGGFQNYSIIKVESREKKEKLVEYCRGQKFIAKAPINLVFCIDYRKNIRINEVIPSPFDQTDHFVNLWMSIIDTAICAHTLCLASESLGLRSVYIGNILNESSKIAELLKLPSFVLPSIMVTLGYPGYCARPSKKWSVKALVHDEEYRDMDMDSLLHEYKEKYSNWNMKPNEKTINAIHKTACDYHGQEFADLCIKSMIENHSISPYQYWFGYYYSPSKDFMEFQNFETFLKEKGFNFLSLYQ